MIKGFVKAVGNGRIHAIADFQDGDRSASDRYFVTIILDDKTVAESRSMTKSESEELAKKINEALSVNP